MASTPAKPVGDINPQAPVFSYAQAAKGSSSAVNAHSAANKSALDTAEVQPKMTLSSQQLSEADDSNQAQSVEKASTPKEKSGEVLLNGTNYFEKELQNSTGLDTSTENNADMAIGSTTFPPQSPIMAASSNPSLSKEEDISATPNASSESTWDRISQASQTDEKIMPRVEGDEDDSKLSSWEHVPQASQLREAPVPTVNVWQKRAQDAQAKAKDAKQGSLSSSLGLKSKAIHTIPTRNSDVPNDHNKSDGRRRTKAADEKGGAQGGKDSSRHHEGKSKTTEDGKRIIVFIIYFRTLTIPYRQDLSSQDTITRWNEGSYRGTSSTERCGVLAHPRTCQRRREEKGPGEARGDR